MTQSGMSPDEKLGREIAKRLHSQAYADNIHLDWATYIGRTAREAAQEAAPPERVPMRIEGMNTVEIGGIISDAVKKDTGEEIESATLVTVVRAVWLLANVPAEPKPDPDEGAIAFAVKQGISWADAPGSVRDACRIIDAVARLRDDRS